MYQQFYGLRAKPFRLSPDPRFFFTGATHQSALAYLRYGLYQGEGFIVVTGPPGTGKSTLVLTLLDEVSRRHSVVGELVTTQLQADDLLRAIAVAFHLDPAGTKSELLARLQAFFSARVAAGRHVILVVDEAQNLPPNSLEELRMLTNFHHGSHALLQCILLGQQPLRDLLSGANMEQLQQRVIASHHLHPLGADETRAYILHRLRKAGWRGDPGFSAEAVSLIYRYTQGIPRRINSLCDRLILYGFLEETHHIDAKSTTVVYREWAEETGQFALNDSQFPWSEQEVNLDGLECEHVEEERKSVGELSEPPLVPSRPAERPASDATSSVYVSPTHSPSLSERTILAEAAMPRQRWIEPSRALTWLRPMGIAAAVLVTASAVLLWPTKPLTEHGAMVPSHAELSSASDKVMVVNSDSESAPTTHSASVSAVQLPAPSSAQTVRAKTEHGHPAPAVQASKSDSEAAVPGTAPSSPPKAQAAASSTSPTQGSINRVKHDQPKLHPRSTVSKASATIASVATPEMTTVPVAPRAKERTSTITASAPPALGHGTSTIDLPDEPTLAIMVASTGSVPVPVSTPSVSSPSQTATVSTVLPISGDELDAVLKRFRGAYESGNMNELVNLFARDARSDDEHNREAIARSYQKLFNVTDARHLALKDVQWQEVGKAMQGEGRFGVTVREKGRDLDSSYAGNISLRIEKRDGQVVITELDHSYAQ